MRRIRDQLFGVVLAAIIAITIGGAIFLQYALWEECRATNSFFYCLRVLSH